MENLVTCENVESVVCNKKNMCIFDHMAFMCQLAELPALRAVGNIETLAMLFNFISLPPSLPQVIIFKYGYFHIIIMIIINDV